MFPPLSLKKNRFGTLLFYYILRFLNDKYDFALIMIWLSLPPDEALQRQEQIWQQEVEDSLSFCRFLSHPSRPKHIDFLRITAPEDDIIDTPSSTPLPPEFQVSRFKDLICVIVRGFWSLQCFHLSKWQTLIPNLHLHTTEGLWPHSPAGPGSTNSLNDKEFLVVT